MEHLIIKELGDGMVRIKAEKGYKVYDTISKRKYSEVECGEDEVSRYCAVKV